MRSPPVPTESADSEAGRSGLLEGSDALSGRDADELL
jgi:hypothetical protein